MIDKVIIAEDHESANFSIEKTVAEFNVNNRDYVYYCDEAFNRIQLALQKGAPYDLLITDLGFDADGRDQKITDGYALIKAVRSIQPAIMVLVFTGEDRAVNINKLYKQYKIDAYVRKARNDIKELKQAFEALSKRETYYSHAVLQILRQGNSFEFEDFDVTVIRLLAEGYRQKEIESYLKAHHIEPNSLSKVEKRLKELRDELGFKKNEQLVLFCKERGLL
ncbi:DNA-binding NarL/FixJ family response regulator [Lacibacter cauensis]|uniref:DNA-binding NarL/FixJ family response regulator n=1 Tax=Lacibacter cauensis TaxID=510947 RepID=A0A562S9E3_9BACT|nr:response regulator transcription factor [Lacibacter cauensis]TWI78011.1 DNA-binding NarL/FixJ family response regulator [Lacibacter cauensis]